ncbi:MAG: urease accessory protein [Verrucomicrobiota bacterium]|jgi:urease accessory protein
MKRARLHPANRPQRTPVSSGQARLSVSLVAGQSSVISARAGNPLKLLIPTPRGRSVSACLTNLGGGYVAGDQTRLDIEVDAGAACVVGTQGSTKIYRNPLRRPCSHFTAARVADEALLVLAPDVVQAYADSTYAQQQEVHLAPGGALVLVDWLSSGRSDAGEHWVFNRYQSRTDIFAADGLSSRRLFLDSLRLESNDGPAGVARSMGRFHCLALLLVLGPMLAGISTDLLADIHGREIRARSALVTSVSPIEGGAILRVAGESVELVRHELHRHLIALTPVLGDDPWSRKF